MVFDSLHILLTIRRLNVKSVCNKSRQRIRSKFDADSEARNPAIVWALEFTESSIRQEYETFPSLEPASNIVPFKGKLK